MYCTYILHSKKIDKFYTGHTNNIQRRLVEHNRGKTSFMEKGKPWILLYCKEFQNRSEAMILEKTIKKRGAARFLADIGKSVG